MAIFTAPKTGMNRGRRIAGRVLIALAVIGIIVVATRPAPYAIEQPGPVFNTLGSARYNGNPTPLLTISRAKTYPTAGSLDMLTVNVDGSPSSPPNWYEVVSAWFDPSQAVVPMDELYPPQQTEKQSDQQSAAEMTDSQSEATAAALHYLGRSFTTTVAIGTVEKGTPAAAHLKKGDVIRSLNGVSYTDATAFRNAVIANGWTTPMTIVLTREGVSHTISITPRKAPATPPFAQLGVALDVKHTFPVDVTIRLQDVGGPSAGMMFALGIIDKLTPGHLNGGKHVAGTGTITASGAVGAIGGIRQKMYGARNAGATYFLAPKSNCTGPDGVAGHIPSGITVFATSSLRQSVAELKAIATGTGLSSLPTCSAK